MEGLEGPGDGGQKNYKIVNFFFFFLSLKEFWLNVSGQFWVVEIQMFIFLFFFFLILL